MAVAQRPGSGRARGAALLAAWLALLCGPAAAFFAPKATLQHGPFDIVAQERRTGSGAFPNLSGNPFKTMPVTEFTVRWRGQKVEVPGRGDRFWRVMRLPDAPRPALLLVAGAFTLVSEKDGQLQVQSLGGGSSDADAVQWLDSDGGQPGVAQSWGLSHVDLKSAAELDAHTRLQGGHWLRIGSQRLLDVQTLALRQVEPWVPHQPGVPVTSLSRAGDVVRAFSPGRTAYVLAASGTDHARGHGTAYGLLVVDIPSGTATELRVQRRRTPFDRAEDLDRRWIAHYFEWQRDAAGRERLHPRAGARPLPWRGRLSDPARGELAYRVPRATAAFADELRRIVLALPGAALAPDWSEPARGIDGHTMRVGECLLGLSTHQAMKPGDEGSGDVAVFAPQSPGLSTQACLDTLRRIAADVDAELASGRHSHLIVLD